MLGEWIKAERERSGLSQARLAREIGRSQTFVARVESGDHRLTVDELVHLSRVIRFDPVELVRRLDDAANDRP